MLLSIVTRYIANEYLFSIYDIARRTYDDAPYIDNADVGGVIPHPRTLWIGILINRGAT